MYTRSMIPAVLIRATDKLDVAMEITAEEEEV